jgi:hypothetical protein
MYRPSTCSYLHCLAARPTCCVVWCSVAPLTFKLTHELVWSARVRKLPCEFQSTESTCQFKVFCEAQPQVFVRWWLLETSNMEALHRWQIRSLEAFEHWSVGALNHSSIETGLVMLTLNFKLTFEFQAGNKSPTTMILVPLDHSHQLQQ